MNKIIQFQGIDVYFSTAKYCKNYEKFKEITQKIISTIAPLDISL